MFIFILEYFCRNNCLHMKTFSVHYTHRSSQCGHYLLVVFSIASQYICEHQILWWCTLSQVSCVAVTLMSLKRWVSPSVQRYSKRGGHQRRRPSASHRRLPPPYRRSTFARTLAVHPQRFPHSPPTKYASAVLFCLLIVCHSQYWLLMT